MDQLQTAALAKLEAVRQRIRRLETLSLEGRVVNVVGTLVESEGPAAGVGDLCLLQSGHGFQVRAEVVGFRGSKLLLMPLRGLRSVAPGDSVTRLENGLTFRCSESWIGRVVDGLGQPLDGGSEPGGERVHGRPRRFDGEPPSPLERPPIDTVFETGVRALDGLLTIGKGQRIGLFAGSGVGKSTLMGMLARGSRADLNIIALLGERGREVGEFVSRQLGSEGLKRSIVVAATSDRSPLERVKGALLATSLAEGFRDEGMHVCLMMDSVTRVAMAQREIGLAVGEPPTTRGYTPSVFTILPRILERAGASRKGAITGIYTVLVEGDDMMDPVADAVRGILDGHIVLSRELAHRNHFPAIDVLESVSRLMSHLVTPEHLKSAVRFRRLLSDLKEARELVALGGYHQGASETLDQALNAEEQLMEFLQQPEGAASTFDNTLESLELNS